MAIVASSINDYKKKGKISMKKVVVLLCAILAVMFTACTYSEADLAAARSEGYNAGYKAGYSAGLSAPKQITKPASGTILSGKEYSGSEITVIADSTYDYVVSLKDSYGTEYVAFYVRAGDTVTIGVPANYLYAYFASGTNWYGYGRGLMFGEDTDYTKDDEMLDFTEYSYEYTLYPVNDGNFSESPSDEDEFF